MKRQLPRLLWLTRSRHIVVTTHKNADPDAAASTYIVHRVLGELASSSWIILPEGLNEVAKKIVAELGVSDAYMGPEILLKNSLPPRTLFIIVDTSSSTQLGSLRDVVLDKPYIVIDHHRPGDLVRGAYASLICPWIRSVSEIVYMIGEELGGLDDKEALLALTGILYDTRRLMYIDDHVFDIVKSIVKQIGAEGYRKAVELLSVEMDFSEKVARLKAAQRMRITRIAGYIIATTHVSAFEASAARGILDLGADVVFVASRNKVSRIVARAKPSFIRETGVSLGRDVMPRIAECLEGGGGGHDAAAAAEGKRSPLRCLGVAVRVLRELLAR